MRRVSIPIFSALIALIVGIAIGHYAFPLQKISPAQYQTSVPTKRVVISPTSSLPSTKSALPPIVDSKESAPDSSSKNLIANLQAILAQPGNRRAYAAFSKLTDSINEKNVHEVIAFAAKQSKAQEKNTLISLILGRWAEFDPKAAIDYAQSVPPGVERNRALSGAINGWAEHDATAAITWAQQLPAGQTRDRAIQTVVSTLADNNPSAALDFMQNLPPGRNRQGLYWPIFNRWAID